MAATKLKALLFILFLSHFYLASRLQINRKHKVTRRRYYFTSVKHTTNGISTFNPTIPSMQCLIDGDVNPNPGPVDENQVSHINLNLPNNGLRAGQWNINRLTNSKFEEIKLLLTSSNQKIDVMFLIETFLKPEVPDCVCEIPGFVLHRKDRAGNRKGCEILTFVFESLRAKRAFELEENELEILWININPFNSNRTILFGTVYRPPSSNLDFDQLFSEEY